MIGVGRFNSDLLSLLFFETLFSFHVASWTCACLCRETCALCHDGRFGPALLLSGDGPPRKGLRASLSLFLDRLCPPLFGL